MRTLPVVVGLVPRGGDGGGAFEILPEGAIMESSSDRPAVPQGAEGTLFAPEVRREQTPGRLLRALRDDVDQTVDRVGAPQRGARAADHFDPIDIGEDGVQ